MTDETIVGNEMVETTATEQVGESQEQVSEVSSSEEKVATNNDGLTQQQDPKTFTQDQVNNLVRERIERERGSFYKRYGVENRDKLDELVAKAQSYEVMCERYDNMRQDLAFIENNVEPSKKDDVLAYFKGKELELNSDALKQEIATHPEWLRVAKQDTKPITTIEKISPDRSIKQEDNERDTMAKLFGLDKII